jgi:hypothetical protein
MDRRTTENNLKARVSAIIEELGLNQCANTRIGAVGENGKVFLTIMKIHYHSVIFCLQTILLNCR